MPKAYLTRRTTFSAAHRLHDPKLSDEENRRIFGKCNHIHGHGHNYVLEVTVQGEVDRSGIALNLSDLKQVIQERILDKVDHKNLNLDIEEFASRNPTAENIAIVFWEWLIGALPIGTLYEIKLHETENISVIYRG